ncbi:GPR1/FUN34/yaaH family-domain-containing protein [Mycotypha africana]|uniref:GPR1/FUN34/yaaH family-domain-containing protein n=1 Tax=Mycotypha africana TaxID=64632 RepID=UPI002301147C|nr:GPR1/FUN34/yaaH family-domain-containing protein [Mycotypha africana]KAI8979618.1 GPR1/FUN34/yaaH family-domain-containing protein [Mycotypha africana]
MSVDEAATQNSTLNHSFEQQNEGPNDIEAKYPNPASSSYPPIPLYAPPTIANPGPLGLCATALCTFVLSLHNAGAGLPADGPNNVVVGTSMFYGGLVQLCAGMWEFKTGNTFGATAFSSYAGFWLSYACIFIPGFNVTGAYTDANILKQSLGLYLLGWAIFSGIMLIASHRSSIGLVTLFFFLFLTFVMLAAAEFNHSLKATVAGGVFGILAALSSWYNALSGLLTKDSSYFTLPVGRLH